MKRENRIVQIQRGRFSPDFQLVRAMLSAATASISSRRADDAIGYIDRAIMRLTEMRNELVTEL